MPVLGARVTVSDGAETGFDADGLTVSAGQLSFRCDGEEVRSFGVDEVTAVDWHMGEVRSGNLWSDEENKRLQRALATGLPPWKIAYLHGRSPSAIGIQAKKLAPLGEAGPDDDSVMPTESSPPPVAQPEPLARERPWSLREARKEERRARRRR